MLFIDDIERLQPYTKHAAWQKITVEAALEVKMFNKTNKNPWAVPNGPAITKFIQRYLNTSVAHYDDGTVERVYRCGSMVNFWAIIDPDTYSTLWFEYHEPSESDYCTLAPITGPRLAGPPLGPIFPEFFLRSITQSTNDTEKGWMSVFRPGFIDEPMSISIETIMIPDESGSFKNSTIYGYLLAAKMIKYHMQSFADNLPGCVSVNSKAETEGSNSGSSSSEF